MKLSGVLKNIASIPPNLDSEIKGLAYDSRKVEPGFLFVAIKGFKEDGHLFLNQAKEKGATAATVEKINKKVDLYQIKVKDSRQALAQAAVNFNWLPTAGINLIGVTGTNGKTTIAFMLESIFKAAGYKSGLVGTVEYKIGDESFPVSHTTPESVELQALFTKMKKAGVEKAAMEVSSHACQLHRIDGCLFDQVIFTNLTQDHLDFHGNLNDYFAAKKRLFEINKGALHIINKDDSFGHRLLGIGKKIATYGLTEDSDFKASNLQIDEQSTHFNVNFEGHDFRFEIMLGGFFNVYNALAAIVSATKLGINPEAIQLGFFNLKSIPGRFEIVLRKPFKVIVDYAHTPNGLENLLKAARQITKGRLITVFGCGGERDIGKRPKMGRIASQMSDIVIVTSDNPRSEAPEDIISQIIAAEGSFITRIDRAEAIQEALKLAKKEDTVVIAGKGHETTQEINGRYIPFSDREVVKEILGKDRGRF